MTLYLSGQVTGTQDYHTRFAQAEKQLIKAGYKVINPCTLPHISNDWVTCMKLDLIHMLNEAQGVCLLNGWKQSRGAIIERSLALNLHIPVKTIKEWTQCIQQAKNTKQ